MDWNGRSCVRLGESIWMWTGNGGERLYMGGSEVKLSRSGLNMSGSG